MMGVILSALHRQYYPPLRTFANAGPHCSGVIVKELLIGRVGPRVSRANLASIRDPVANFASRISLRRQCVTPWK
jgi:hypothetical protein